MNRWFRLWIGLAAAVGVTVAATEPWTAPPEEIARPNPVDPTPESLDRGREIFVDLCAPCHGDDGAGDAEVEEVLDVEVGDLTSRQRLARRSDGELHWRIRVGSDTMPQFGEDLEDGQIWDVINYVRTLGASEEAPQATPER